MTESSRSGSSRAWGPGDRLAVCYGTRPQVIKASVLTDTLARRWPLLTIDTGQHFDDHLQRVFYTQLGVPEPDYCLEGGAANPAQQVADILTRASQIFARERPWAVVVLGDTNSTLGCARRTKTCPTTAPLSVRICSATSAGVVAALLHRRRTATVMHAARASAAAATLVARCLVGF